MRLLKVVLLGLVCFLAAGCSEIKLPLGVSYSETPFIFYHISWSPDNSKLAGSALAPTFGDIPPTRIYIWEIDTGRINLASGETGLNNYPSWNPKKNLILYYSSDDFEGTNLGLFNTLSNTKEPVSAVGGFSDWFADGDNFLTENGSTLYQYSLSRMESKKIWTESYTGSIEGLSLSPDEGYIAVIISDGLSREDDLVILINDRDEIERVLYQSPARLDQPDWYRDGKWISFVSVEDGRHELLAIQVETGCTTLPLPIDADILDASWSDDGTLLAVSVSNSTKSGVYIIESDSQFIQNWLNSGSCYTG